MWRRLRPIGRVIPDASRRAGCPDRAATDVVAGAARSVALQKHPPRKVAEKALVALASSYQGKFSGYPEDFAPRPLGAALYDHEPDDGGQNARAAKLVLFDFDFEPGTSRLSPEDTTSSPG